MTPDPTTRDPAASLRACIELAAKATPGEWSQSHRKVNDGYSTQIYDVWGAAIATLAWHALPTQIEDGRAVTRTDRAENAAAICAAVNFLRDAAPALLVEVARLTAEVARKDAWRKVENEACQAAEQVAREAVALLRETVDAAGADFAMARDLERRITTFLAHHGARTGDSHD